MLLRGTKRAWESVGGFRYVDRVGGWRKEFEETGTKRSMESLHVLESVFQGPKRSLGQGEKRMGRDDDECGHRLRDDKVRGRGEKEGERWGAAMNK